MKEYTSDELAEIIKSKTNIKIVDIRHVLEWRKEGIIEDSKTITLFDDSGNVDGIQTKEEFLKNGIGENDEMILVCRSGGRTSAGMPILKELGFSNVSHLKGGLFAWVKSGRKLTIYKK